MATYGADGQAGSLGTDHVGPWGRLRAVAGMKLTIVHKYILAFFCGRAGNGLSCLNKAWAGRRRGVYDV